MKANQLILLAVLVFTSCAPKQKIIPLVFEEKTNPQSSGFSSGSDFSTVPADTQNDPVTTTTNNDDAKPFYVEGSYFFEDMDIEKPVDSRLNIVDSVLNNIFSVIVKIGGNFEVASDPIPLDLADLDKEVVKELYIYNLDLEIVEPEQTKANLKFMKEITIKLVEQTEPKCPKQVEKPKSNLDILTNREDDDFSASSDDKATCQEEPANELVAIHYRLKDEKNKEHSKKCNYKCIRIPVSGTNLLNFIGTTKKVMVVPIIKLGAAPKDNFAVKGRMRFRVGLNIDL